MTTPDGTFFIGTEDSPKLCRRKAVLHHDRPNARSRWSLSPCPPTDPNQHAASTRNLALLRTSKAVYAEAGAILYGQKLVFTNTVALQSFLVVLRPSQISLLRHVVVGPDHWARIEDRRDVMHYLIPSVFALLAGAHSLETLKPDMRWLGPRCLTPNKAVIRDESLSIAEWDAVVARIMAAEVYRHLFTYLRPAAAARGIEKVLEVLDVFGDDFRIGPFIAFLKGYRQPRHMFGVEWTEERKAALRKAMDEEIERLLKEDAI